MINTCAQYFILIISCVLGSWAYTPYPPQATHAIRVRQKQIWDSETGTSFSPTEIMTFIVETKVFFYINSSSFPQTVKMRGRAYFVDDHRKFSPIQELSPFDVSKVYIYHQQSGMIIKSEQFYESFAFSLPLREHSLYKLVFEDGPPGPLKIIQWEIDYQIIPSEQPAVGLQQDMKLLQTRIISARRGIQDLQKIQGMPKLRDVMIHQMLMNSIESYCNYLYVQAIMVAVLIAFETVMLKRALGTNIVV